MQRSSATVLEVGGRIEVRWLTIKEENGYVCYVEVLGEAPESEGGM